MENLKFDLISIIFFNFVSILLIRLLSNSLFGGRFDKGQGKMLELNHSVYCTFIERMFAKNEPVEVKPEDKKIYIFINIDSLSEMLIKSLKIIKSWTVKGEVFL